MAAAVMWINTAAAEDFRPWPEYQVIMWTGDSAYAKPAKLALFFQRLREMGITAGMVSGDSSMRPVLDARFPYYVENIVNKGLCLKWNSNVRDWDKWVTQWKDKRDEDGLVREYSFDDPQWRDWAQKEMKRVVRKHAPHAPLLYNIRDELSVTQSANPFDFDFSLPALAGFREWLRKRYGALDALNAGWETQFKTWDEVKPFTTDQIKNRMASGFAIPQRNPNWQALVRLNFDPATARKRPTAWNFSPWADHRTYMDVSLASMVGDLRHSARKIDPKTPVGIEGTQMPSAFGGYDLWRLSQSIDWVEPYDVGDAREIFGSFMPGKPILSTVGERDAKAASRRLWHLLLLGDKGCVVWWSEDCIDWDSEDYALTERANALSPVLKAMTSPLARLFLRAKRESDPIAIHYSQPSIQVAWLIESIEDGSSWLRRFSSYEAKHNKHARVRHAWLETLEDLGYSPRFVSSEQIERGELKNFSALVLPQSYALGDSEIKAITAFEGTLLLDGGAGHFDEHARIRKTPPFDFPPGAHALVAGERTDFAQDMVELAAGRLGPTSPDAWYDWLAARVRVPVTVKLPPGARVQTHRFRLGPVRLLAFERNISYAMGGNLKQGGGNQALELPVEITATIDVPEHVYDLRAGRYLGKLAELKFTLDPWQPTLIAVSPQVIRGADVIAALHALADSP